VPGDRPLSGLRLTCDSPESSSTMASQVNFDLHWMVPFLSIYDFLLGSSYKLPRQINLTVRWKQVPSSIIHRKFWLAHQLVEVSLMVQTHNLI
jgi:hypothetical protein